MSTIFLSSIASNHVVQDGDIIIIDDYALIANETITFSGTGSFTIRFPPNFTSSNTAFKTEFKILSGTNAALKPTIEVLGGADTSQFDFDLSGMGETTLTAQAGAQLDSTIVMGQNGASSVSIANGVTAGENNEIVVNGQTAGQNIINLGDNYFTDTENAVSLISGLSGSPSPSQIVEDIITIGDNFRSNDADDGFGISTGAGNDSIIFGDNAFIGQRISATLIDMGAGEDYLQIGTNFDNVDGAMYMGDGDDTVRYDATLDLGFIAGPSDIIYGDAGTDLMILQGTTAQFNSWTTTLNAFGYSYDAATKIWTQGTNADMDDVDFVLRTNTSFEGFEQLRIVCFGPDVLIATDKGAVPSVNIEVGDLVLTADHGFQPVRWIGKRQVPAHELRKNPRLLPVKISQGALGNGLPKRDMVVSRQHRMVVNNEALQGLNVETEVLVAAIKLTALPGIDVSEAEEQMSYVHFMFDQHEIVYAEGAKSESLLLGPQARETIADESLEEIVTLFPELADGDMRPEPARLIPSNREQKAIVADFAKKISQKVLETI